MELVVVLGVTTDESEFIVLILSARMKLDSKDNQIRTQSNFHVRM
jgi:hypothetical protein